MTNSVTIPWPDKSLNPNTRTHGKARARIEKIEREAAYWLTKNAWVAAPAEGEVHVYIDFYPPDNRRRDIQNAFSAAKALVDGFADAIERDDSCFVFTLRRASPVKGGKVVLSIDQFAGLADAGDGE